MNILLSSYPLSKSFLDAFGSKVSEDVTPISLNELKRKKLLQFILRLRRQKVQTIYIAAEDGAAAITIPIMQIFSFLVGAKHICTVDTKIALKTVKASDVLYNALAFMGSCFIGLYDVLCITVRVLWLISRTREESYRYHSKSIYYIKSNLWYGIKAGGSVGHVAGVVNAFIEKKWRLHFFSAERPDMASSQLQFHEILFPRPYIYPTDLNNVVYDRALTHKICKYAKKAHFDGVIYQRMSVFNCTGVVISRMFKRPLILEYNGSEVWVSANWGRASTLAPLAKLCEKVCLKHAHRIVTVSQVLKDELIARGVEEERIVLYPNCIDPDCYDNTRFSAQDCLTVRSQYNLEERDTVATFVGTFGMWHGVDILATTIKQLVDGHKSELDRLRLRFMLVGDGFMMPKVKSLIGSEKYSEYVRFTGLLPQQEGPLVLSASDILLSPHKANEDGSRFFGSPTKLFEYMGVRKPIIASDLEQISEVISPSLRLEDLKNPLNISKEVGVLCQPNNVKELAEAILLTAQRSEELTDLGKNARQKVVDLYTWDRHVQYILDAAITYASPVDESSLSPSYNLQKMRNTPYYHVGPLPPPYGGVSVFFERYSSRLKKTFPLTIIDTSRLTVKDLLKLFFGVVFNPKYFILHINSVNLMALTLLNLRLFPFYLRIQDHSERRLESYGRFKRKFVNLLFKRVDELILVGHHLKDYYRHHEIEMPPKVRVKTPFVPPLLDEEESILATYPESLNIFLKQKSPLIIVNAYKIIFHDGVDLYGFDMSIRLLEELRSEYPDMGLILALADSEDKKRLAIIEKEISAKGLEPSVYFLTNQKQLWPLFKKVDLMIRPTFRDGYGISVAEALYLGCPAIASDVCLRPQGTILFKNRDQKDLEVKVRNVLSDTGQKVADLPISSSFLER